MSRQHLKVLLLGDYGCGRTSLLSRHADGTFSDVHITTIGAELKACHMDINGVELSFEFWDCGGNVHQYSSYNRDTNGVVVCYDISRKSSFDRCSGWLAEVAKFESEDVGVLLVGLKSDLEDQREVSLSEASRFAQSAGLKAIETSAKTRSNVKEAFDLLGQVMLQTIDPPPIIFTVVSVEPSGRSLHVMLTMLSGESFGIIMDKRQTTLDLKAAVARTRGVRCKSVRIISQDGRLLKDSDNWLDVITMNTNVKSRVDGPLSACFASTRCCPVQ